MQAELACRDADHAVGARERGDDRLAIELHARLLGALDRGHVRLTGLGRHTGGFREILESHEIAPGLRGRDDRELDGALELALVVGPRSQGAGLEQLRVDREAGSRTLALDDAHDVERACPQWWQLDDLTPQRARELGQETALVDGSLQLVAARRDDREVDRRSSGRPDRDHLAVDHGTEQALLRARVEVAHLVEDERTAARELHLAERAHHRSERSMVRAEQHPLGEPLGKRAAVHDDEGPVVARARRVVCASGADLRGTSLGVEQDVATARGVPAQVVECTLELGPMRRGDGRRVIRRVLDEAEQRVADAQDREPAHAPRGGDALAIDEGAVATAQIRDAPRALGVAHPRVLARHALVAELERLVARDDLATEIEVRGQPHRVRLAAARDQDDGGLAGYHGAHVTHPYEEVASGASQAATKQSSVLEQRVYDDEAVRLDPYGIALGKFLYPAWEKLRGRPTFELLAMLRQSERASLDELTAMRLGFLRRLVRHAYQHTQHYRDAFDKIGLHPEDIRTLADLAKIPLLPRELAQTTVDQRTAPWPRTAVTKTTSGSTGQPLEVRISAESRHWRDATRWRGFGWGGYRMGDKAMHLWGVPAIAPTRWAQTKLALDHRFRRDIYANCMVRSKEKLLEMTHTIVRERPQAILGYAQAIADLSRFINTEGLRTWDTIPVIYGAERLWPHDRDDVARAFGPEVYETYGCREFMLMGSECEAHDGLHESVENLIVELLVREADGSVRTAMPGELGEVAVTDLHNLACPFIRYLTGDLAVARAPTPCSCGRTLPRFGPVEGRVTDTMRDADGNPVEGILFNILFLNMAKHTRQFQVVQRADRRLILRIVPGPGGLPAPAEALIREFVGKHLRGVPLEIEIVPEITLTRAGKLRRVIVETN